jgi:hypothetical protein
MSARTDSVISGQLRELENEREPRRRRQLATALGTRMIRTADRKSRKRPPRPVREPEPEPAPRSTKWRPLHDLRSLLRGRCEDVSRNEKRRRHDASGTSA